MLVLPTKTIDASAPSVSTPRKGLVGHVIFHDVDKLCPRFLFAGKLVKGHHIPVADQTDLSG